MKAPESLCRLAAVTALLAAGLTSAAPAGATTILPTSLEEMAQTAEVVVRGEVLESEGRLDTERGMVFTHVIVGVAETLRGRAPGGTVEVIVPGGVDEAMAAWSRVDGSPDLGPPGQEVVVFLYEDRGDYLSNVVFWQGLYHVDDGTVRETNEPVGVFLDRVRDLLPVRPEQAGGPEAAGSDREEVLR